MPGIAQHTAAKTTKVLCVGPSGTGKTGALAALASRGFKLRIMDFDKGLDILYSYLTNPKSPYVIANPKAAENVEYLPFHSKIKNIGGKLVPVRAAAWQDAIEALMNWQEYKTVDGKKVVIPGSERGPITTWDTETVLVVDSFTVLNYAALDFVMQLQARVGQGIRESDWGDGQQLVLKFLDIVTDPEVKCNVILNCHVKDVSKENEPSRLFPWALGKALPPEIPRNFNTLLEFKQKGATKVIATKALGVAGGLQTKTSNPMAVKDEYPLEWGLADYFAAVRSA